MAAIPPPLIIGAPFVAGMGLQWLFPLEFPARGLGLALAGLCIPPALILLATARSAFRRSRNSMRYTHRSRALIMDGPYRFTRNPLFAGLLLLYAGATSAVGAPWPLLFLPIAAILLHRTVVIPEERFLEERFGGEYCAYKARVRHWF